MLHSPVEPRTVHLMVPLRSTVTCTVAVRVAVMTVVVMPMVLCAMVAVMMYMVYLLVGASTPLLLHHIFQHTHHLTRHHTLLRCHQHRLGSDVHLGHARLRDNVVWVHICDGLCGENHTEHTQDQQPG